MWCTQEAVQEVRQIIGRTADIAEKTLKAGREAARRLHQDVQDVKHVAWDKKQCLFARLEKFLDLGEKIISQARQMNAGSLKLPER